MENNLITEIIMIKAYYRFIRNFTIIKTRNAKWGPKWIFSNWND